MVRMLVAAGADVNARGMDSRTPLHCLASRAEFTRNILGDEDERAKLERWVGAIEALLAAGADVNAKTSDGKTPISIVNDRLREAKDAEDTAGLRRTREILLKAGAVE